MRCACFLLAGLLACDDGGDGHVEPEPDAKTVAGGEVDAEHADACAPNSCGICGPAPVELCNGVDDDCDGDLDEGALNSCGGCGPVPLEVCNGADDDCDGAVDESVTNACGACGPAPLETCNERDDDCDGSVDEGVLNTCGKCGRDPVEVCDGEDNDCDGETDEHVLNRCGACGPVFAEACNGRDDDCDGAIDEGVTNACGACGPVPLETCNERDDDCDGAVDEGALNACGGCGSTPAEVCGGGDEDCDGAVDEGLLNACGGCGPAPPEVCNERDDDCDDHVDEGLLNACGRCGPVPVEVCNQDDDDCDGAVDEGVPPNRCGQVCGPEPVELCNRFDDDCDGTLDEGLPVNACGVCGALPTETCNEADDDCDGEVDEGLPRNRCGTCGESPAEVCNGEDDDCDLRVDEDFHVRRSLEHCEGCNQPCSQQNAAAACVVGRCVVVACDEGFADLNEDPSDGCEAPVPDRPEIHVDDDAEPGGDGSDARPFRSIDEALRDPPVNARVRVRAGTYSAFTIRTEGVWVEAVEEGVLVHGAPEGGAATGSADRASVRGLHIDGEHRSRFGILLDCTGCSAVDNQIRRIGVGPEPGPSIGVWVRGSGALVRANHVRDIGPGASLCAAQGIRVEGARAVVTENRIEGLRGTGDIGELACPREVSSAGGDAVGIWLESANGARIRANTVRDLLGGAGGNPPGEAPGGDGGSAFGVVVHRSTDVVLDGSGVDPDGQPWVFEELEGARAGVSEQADYAGVPGAAVGVALVDSNDVTVSALRVQRLRGGEGTETGRRGGTRGGKALGARIAGGARISFVDTVVEGLAGGLGAGLGGLGPVFGYELLGDTEGLLVDASNAVHGQPLYLNDGTGADILVEGLRVHRAVPASNLGQIVVRRVRGVVLRDNHLSGVIGGTGPTLARRLEGPFTGESVIGIHLAATSGLTRVEGNHVASLTGGRGGSTSSPAAAPGGGAIGLRIESCEGGIVLEHNAFVDLVGGGGGRGGAVGQHLGDQGPATAILVTDSSFEARNTLVASMGSDPAVEQGRGFDLRGVSDVVIRDASLYRLPFAGVVVSDGSRAIALYDTIFESALHPVWAAGNEGVLHGERLAYTGDEPPPGEDLLLLGRDGCFEAPREGDFRLREGSPCVDAGDPSAACDEEPRGDGGLCRRDIGHFAGTAQASAR